MDACNHPRDKTTPPLPSHAHSKVIVMKKPLALLLTLSLLTGTATAQDDALEENDTCRDATPVGEGVTAGLFVSQTDKDHFIYCVDGGTTLSVDLLFTDADGDIDCFLRKPSSTLCGTGIGADLLAQGFSASDDEHMQWTNPGTVPCCVVIEVNMWDDPSNSADNTYQLVISGAASAVDGSDVGVAFCDPANANSSGLPADLTGGCGSCTGSGLHLEVYDGPPNEFGYLLVGTGSVANGILISNGLLCLDQTPGNLFGRYNVAGGTLNSVGLFDAMGRFINLVGTSSGGAGFDVPLNLPFPGNPAILAGDSFYFQMWYRDTPNGPGSSNFSNGLCVTF